jgi:nucleoside-diphosphate-sugar epimerase
MSWSVSLFATTPFRNLGRLMQVLITGANSFLGRHVTVALCSAGLKVAASFRTDGTIIDQLRELAPSANLVRLDLTREDDFAALPRKVDAIVHTAGVSIMPGVTVDDLLACNVVGTRNLVAYARRAEAARIVFSSTLSIHGEVNEPEVTETSPVRAPDMYGASKYLAERILAEEARWLSCAALRLPGVLGAGAHRAWIPTLLERIKSHKDVTVYNPQMGFNNAVHVHDIGDLLLKLLAGNWSGFHAFPVGAAGQISISNLVNLLMSLTGSRSQVTEGQLQKRPFTVSSNYATRVFGYDPMNIETMLRRYVGESR